MIVKDEHFSTIANDYRKLRSTEKEPVQFIRNQLKRKKKIIAADIGCGCGRYSLQLFRYLEGKLFLYCIDNNEQMLKQLNHYLKQNNIKRFEPKLSVAERIPLPDQSIDTIFTFNAIHHFKIFNFMNEVKRTLKQEGNLFIYTRTCQQNRRHIWGKYFPWFCEKETRLYEIEEMSQIINRVQGFRLEKIKLFEFLKTDSLDHLLFLATNHHYSTFSLYSTTEFERALQKFKKNIETHFNDLNRISWYNENVMYVVRVN